MRFAAGVGALAAGATLLASGWMHAVGLEAFRRTLLRQGIWPSAIVPIMPPTIAIGELLLGGATLIALLEGGEVAGLLLAVDGFLYLAYTFVGIVLLRRHSTVPCGCYHDEPVGIGTVARSAVLAGFSGVGSIAAPNALVGLSVGDSALLSLAGAAFTIILWQVPRAMTVPSLDEEAA